MELRTTVTKTLLRYFATLEGDDPYDIYNLVISEVEKPLLEITMSQANYNQSKAAKWLNISRNTLRKLLAKYNINCQQE